MQKLFKKGNLIPISNNLGDQSYFKKGTGISSKYIPSLCQYTNETYKPINNKFILVCENIHLTPNNKLICHKSSLGHGYSWRDLYNYRGIIHIPYELSTMSIFEQYTANIPLFFPSKFFLKKLVSSKIVNFNSIYWKVKNPICLKKFMDINTWIDNADYYNEGMPYIIYFDSWEDLILKLEETDCAKVSKLMEDFNKKRKNEILENYKKITITLNIKK